MSEQSLDARVGKVEGQISSLAGTLTEFIHKQDQREEGIYRAIENLRKSASPNMANQIAGLGLVLGIMMAIGGLCGFFMIREFDRVDANTDKLDSKLQIEYKLSNDAIALALDNANKITTERDVAQTTRINRLEKFQDEQVQSDLNELRERRMHNKP